MLREAMLDEREMPSGWDPEDTNVDWFNMRWNRI